MKKTVAVDPPIIAKEASIEDLLGTARRFTAVQSLKAVVTLQLNYLNDERTKENILLDVNGAIVAQRPDSIRVQAQMPVVRQKAFDMASHDGAFQVYLTFKNRFFEGSTTVVRRSEKRSENIRPQHILEPLLLDPMGEQGVLALDTFQEGRTPYYIIQELIEDGDLFRINRKLWFSRATLTISRLEIRDKNGEVATTAYYSGWADHGEKLFPETVIIDRPIDGYTLTVKFVKPGIDEPPTENAFVLEPPDGLEVENVDEVAEAVTDTEKNP